jgi:2'-5' RNA ligase superfamily
MGTAWMTGLATGLRATVARARSAAGAATGAVTGQVAMWLLPATALIVPTLEAEPAVAAWLGKQKVAFHGAPLHVTVMYPFLPARAVTAADEADVAALAASVEPFAYSLDRVDQFPGVYYLAPMPPSPFVAITERIQQRWPACVPYGGEFDFVVPHVAVAFGEAPPADLAALAARLPIASRAEEFWLIEQNWRGWRLRRRFPLGGPSGNRPRGPGARLPGGGAHRVAGRTRRSRASITSTS